MADAQKFLAENWSMPQLLGLTATLSFLLAFILFVQIVRKSSLPKRLWAVLEDNVLGNWRLVLLGLTGIVLSLASGWTTWDGMRNFTNEPLLSLMITFGIQGVMLIVAWLIGESFAVGMAQGRSPNGPGWRAYLNTIVGPLLIVGFLAASYWLARGDLSGTAIYVILGIGGLALALVITNMISRNDVIGPYLQGTRIVAKNAVLWIMFLACMTTSVFFSFDSLFSQIFPAAERKRAADLRAQNQVAGIIADIGALAQRRRVEEAQELFRSKAWHGYEGQLDRLTLLARQAPDAIQQQFEQRIRQKAQAIALRQEELADAKSQQASLARRKVALREDLTRLKTDRPSATTAVQQQQVVVSGIEQSLDELRAKTLAEERGVEGSGKAGRGQFWRAARAEEARTKAQLEVARKRLSARVTRLAGIDTQLARITAEIAQFDGELAKLRGKAATAVQLIKVAKDAGKSETARHFDPASGLAQLDKARVVFRQRPEKKSLATIQALCGTMLAAIGDVPSLKVEARGLDCDPGPTSEAAGRVFSLNSGLVRIEKTCARGENFPRNGGVDTLMAFAGKCVQDSGLSGRDTAALRTTLNAIALNRDDKAHRFVVTWNAFLDRNRLAYLALAIAIAIDGLVFMSGLFGANAVRSPLSDVPTDRARSASELIAVVENALLPNRFETSRLTLGAMRPTTNQGGFMSEVILDGYDALAAERIRHVLNAGATIGAVLRDSGRGSERYLVRGELYEFLSLVCKREFERSDEHLKTAALDEIISVALAPDPPSNAGMVLNYLYPTSDHVGYVSIVDYLNVDSTHKPIVQNVLNAGSSMQEVFRDGIPDADKYFITPALYRCLALINARPKLPRLAQSDQVTQIAAPGTGRPIQGDNPTPPTRQLEASRPPLDGTSVSSPMPSDVRLPANARAPSPAAPPVDYEALFRGELLKAMGLNEQAYAEVFNPLLVGSAVNAGKALDQSRSTNAALSMRFRERENDMQDALDQAYRRIWTAHDQNVEGLNALNAVRESIESHLAALMLSRGGPYEQVIKDLIKELESAAQADGGPQPEDQRLLDLLRDYSSALSDLDRHSAEAWSKVGNLVFRYGRGGERDTITANA